MNLRKVKKTALIEPKARRPLLSIFFRPIRFVIKAMIVIAGISFVLSPDRYMSAVSSSINGPAPEHTRYDAQFEELSKKSEEHKKLLDYYRTCNKDDDSPLGHVACLSGMQLMTDKESFFVIKRDLENVLAIVDKEQERRD